MSQENLVTIDYEAYKTWYESISVGFPTHFQPGTKYRIVERDAKIFEGIMCSVLAEYDKRIPWTVYMPNRFIIFKDDLDRQIDKVMGNISDAERKAIRDYLFLSDYFGDAPIEPEVTASAKFIMMRVLFNYRLNVLKWQVAKNLGIVALGERLSRFLKRFHGNDA